MKPSVRIALCCGGFAAALLNRRAHRPGSCPCPRGRADRHDAAVLQDEVLQMLWQRHHGTNCNGLNTNCILRFFRSLR